MLIETAIQELLATVPEPGKAGAIGVYRSSRDQGGYCPTIIRARGDMEACVDDFLAYCRSVAPHARTVEELPANCQGCWRILCAYYNHAD